MFIYITRFGLSYEPQCLSISLSICLSVGLLVCPKKIVRIEKILISPPLPTGR